MKFIIDYDKLYVICFPFFYFMAIDRSFVLKIDVNEANTVNGILEI